VHEGSAAEVSVGSDARGLGDSQLQSNTLESLTAARNYHRWLTELAEPYLGKRPIELGSGLGDYAQTWLDSGTPEITVTELDAGRLSMLRHRFDGDSRVTVTSLDVLNPPRGEYSSLVAFNVLEHIDDHVRALSAAHSVLAPGGAVIMFVPAFPFAMGDFDRKVGHFRRYTKRTLRECYRAAGLDIEQLRYVNAPGLPTWFLAVRLLRMTPGDSLLLRLWDRFVTPVARAIERRIAPPFGQSVFAVGRVPS
jgi:SAM-dependent methyltransferase